MAKQQVKVNFSAGLQTFLKQDWDKGTKRKRLWAAMKSAGIKTAARARNFIKAARRLKPESSRTAAKTFGWKDVKRGLTIFGIKHTPRKKIGKFFTSGEYTNSYQKTAAKMDWAFIINFFSRDIRLNERINMTQEVKEMEQRQIKVLETQWKKGRLRV